MKFKHGHKNKKWAHNAMFLMNVEFHKKTL